MSMDKFLDDFFGTTKEASAAPAPSDEDKEKQAQAEMFHKLAAKNGIDVGKLNDAEVEWLWNRTFSKEASEHEPEKKEHEKEEHKEHEKKMEEAKKEHEEKHAQAKILEEGTFLGKVAAHAYVSELKKIAAAGGLNFKVAGELPPQFKKHDEKEHEEHEKKEEKHEGKEHEEHEKKNPFKKEGSFDLAAAERALKLIGDAGLDTKVATARLNAVLTLGLKESEKVAAISNFDEALQRRALEFAEQAGYPVDWTK